MRPSHLPAILRRRVAREGHPQGEPRVLVLQAAALFADVTGFSSLADRLGQEGPSGIERLSDALSRCFGRAIDLAMAYGGDVVAFAGDGLLALWPETDPEGGLMAAVGQAAWCGRALQAALAHANLTNEFDIRMSVTIGAGQVGLVEAGGVGGHWLPFVVGDALLQIGQVQSAAAPHEVLLSSQAWRNVPKVFEGTVADNGAIRLASVLAQTIPPTADAVPTDRLEDNLVAPYLAPPLRAPERAGHERWLNELRLVSMAFVRIPDAGAPGQGSVGRMHDCIRALQAVTQRYGGMIDKVVGDEKGTYMVAIWGLPSLTHEDDATRATRCALEMHQALQSRAADGSVGVATGRVFCGFIGTDVRTHYTVVGGAANLAARLMQEARGTVLCDHATYLGARRDVEFRERGRVRLKGIGESIRCHEPISTRLQRATRHDIPLAGRQAEISRLDGLLDELLRGHGATVLIEGEPGVGKSRLLNEFRNRAQEHGVRCLSGAGDSIEQTAPYHAWRHVLGQLLDLPEAALSEELHSRVLDVIADDPLLRGEAAPLNDLLGLSLPEPPGTKLGSDARASRVHRLVVELLQRPGASPRMLLLDDGHWFDSASWALLREVCHQVPDLLTVVAFRSMTDQPADLRHMLDDGLVTLTQLDRLSDADTTELARARLGVDHLPDAVSRLLRERADGVPFVAEELIFALIDSGGLRVDGRSCRLRVEELPSGWLPDTVEGMVASRIDRLPRPQQRCLKVASVVGRKFSRNLVADLLGEEFSGEELDALLGRLENAHLLRRSDLERLGTYEFRHAIAQEAVYQRMLFAQRRELHARVASWIEARHAEELSPVHPVLAHHWTHAGLWDKALPHVDAAARHALERSANAEAATLYRLAVDVAERLDEPLPDTRIAEWEAGACEALYRNGKLMEARLHGRRALRLLGKSPRSSKPGQLGATLGLTLGRGLRWGLHLTPTRLSEEAIPERLRAVRVQNQLAELAIYCNDAIDCLYSGLRVLALAEPAGPSRDLARALSLMGVVVSIVPMHRLAQRWSQRALDMLEHLGDDPATHAYVASRMGIFHLHRGEWPEALRHFGEAIRIADEVGERRLLEETLATMALTQHFRAKHAESVALWDRAARLGRASRNEQARGWPRLGRAWALMRLGHLDEARVLTECARDWTETRATGAEQIFSEAVVALTALGCGDLGDAEAAADRALTLIQAGRPAAYWLQAGIGGVCETYLKLWRACPRGAAASSLRSRAKIACRSMRRFARVFPFGEPFAHCFTAEWLLTDGRHKAARRSFLNGLRAARRLDMPFDEALAHCGLSRVRGAAPGEAEEHRRAADEIFERLEVASPFAGSPQ